ncbi:MAG: hypothetical protein K8H88_26105 [Sandaracinaceae bacterium]|nr:hypothetical protein [Sandaracinaceae bacterium]
MLDHYTPVGARLGTTQLDVAQLLRGESQEWTVCEVPRSYLVMAASREIGCALTDSTVACWRMPGLSSDGREDYWSVDVLDAGEATDLVADNGVVCTLVGGRLGPCAGQRDESLILRFWQTPRLREIIDDEEHDRP